ncbi:MAG: redox-regulated ATPase YchF [Spirochaetales bacterium]|nr:redox-regulated ATPase YchF [Spirochaetales bacterium]
MNLGLIGREKAGKTTIFNALTGKSADVSEYTAAKLEPNRAVVEVLDKRVDVLTEQYQPKKTIYATIHVTDFVGLSKGSAEHSLFSVAALGLIKTVDSLALVLRNFSNPVIDEVYGPADPVKELDTLLGELVLTDQIVVERRLEKINEDLKRGKKDAHSAQEEKALQRLLEVLSEGGKVRDIDLNAEEEKTLAGFQFLTAKPIFAILNSGEENYGKNEALEKTISAVCPVIEFAGTFEMELAGLKEDEAAEFMSDLGITESARSRLTTFAHDILGYISFFTVGKDEVRAWTIRRGENAVDAAGTIHSDLARGFIRAECFTYDDFAALGSEKAVKEKGLFRLEGKDYIVKDGDILNIRFSV